MTEGGIFSASFITYKVQTSGSSIDYEVRRKDADFYFLRKHLLRCFPHIIIPPCPKDQPKLIAERIKRREKYYTRFLQAIARCEELKTNKFLLSFLAEKDLKTFQKVQKEHEKMKEQLKQRPFTDLVTFSGTAKIYVQSGGPSQKFSHQTNDYAESYQILQRAMI